MKGDPYWMVAKFNGRDADGNAVRKGDRVFYFPKSRTLLSGEKAEAAAAEFEASRADEASYCGGGF